MPKTSKSYKWWKNIIIFLKVDPKIYSSLVNGWRTILKSEGPSGLFAGWGPTLTGYSIQGACKFGFYEYFKNFYGDMVGPEKSHSTPVYLAASASAEVIADVAFCPLEATKVRMQTGLAGKLLNDKTITNVFIIL